MMRVLMCNPQHFRIGAEAPELNPWMDLQNQPDRARALEQFAKLRSLYIKLGVEVHLLEPEPSLFDQVFTANTAWGIDDAFVMANLRPGWRRPESMIVARWLVARRLSIHWLSEPLFFEGQGDIVTTRDAHLYCYGIRNSLEAVEEVGRRLNLKKPVMPLRLISTKTYHGDVCLRYLGPRLDKLLWYPGAFDETSNRLIENLRVDKKAVDEKFIVQELAGGRRNFPLNGIYHQNVQTFPWHTKYGEFPQDVKDWIEKDGGEVVLLDFSEFGLSGAGHRCVTLFLD